MDLAAVYKIVDGVLQRLAHSRTEEEFEEMYKRATEKAASVGLDPHLRYSFSPQWVREVMMWCPHKISFSLQDPDAAQTESQPGTMVSIIGRTSSIMHNSSCANRCVSQNSHTSRQLYATHLKRQIELADVQIRYKKRKMQDMNLKTEIKRGTLRKLDLEIKKLEREVSYAFNGEPFNAHCMLTVTQSMH